METRKMIVGMVMVVFVLMSGVVWGQSTWYVSPEGSDEYGQGSESLPYRTVGKAVDEASDRDTIILLEGTHDGFSDQGGWTGYTIDPKNKQYLVFTSENPLDPDCVANTIVVGTRGGAPPPNPPGPPYTGRWTRCCSFTGLQDRDCKLVGLTIIAGPADHKYIETDTKGAIYCEDSGPTISDCIIITGGDANDVTGIYCCAKDASCNALIRDCNITGLTGSAVYAGIQVWACNVETPRVVNCDIKGCIIKDNDGMGIWCNATMEGEITIDGCTVSRNGLRAGEPGVAFNLGPGNARIINNCTISENAGGGIYYKYEEINECEYFEISDCTISGNYFLDHDTYKGPGILLDSSRCDSVVIKDSEITNNEAGGDGGGIRIPICKDVNIINCTFSGNKAARGGGLHVGGGTDGGSVVVMDCVISDNEADEEGGGILNETASLTVVNCEITGNKALASIGPCGGGGISSEYGLDAINCLITGNVVSGDGDGGGVYLVNAGRDAKITNCTIADNFAEGYGGGLATVSEGSYKLYVENCILWGSTAAGAGLVPGHQIYDGMGERLYVYYSDAQDGNDAVRLGTSQWPIWENNIDEDPLFVGSGYWGNGALRFDGQDDYVSLGSPDSLEDLPDNTFTISAWIFDEYTTANTWGTIFGCCYSNIGWSVRTLSNGSGDRSLHFRAIHSNRWATYQSSYGTITPNTWHHVAAVWNENNTATLYIDGTETTYEGQVSALGTYKSDAANDKDIGRIPHAGGTQYFKGTIHEMMIFDEALSSTDIEELYERGSGWATGGNAPLSYWKFDEGSGSTAYDSEAGGNDGTVYGAEWTTGWVQPLDPCMMWINGDYHISRDSVCIDAGDNLAVPADSLDLDKDSDETERIPVDLDWRLRFVDIIPPVGGTGRDSPDYDDIIVDMGAYERQELICHWKFDEGSGTIAYDSAGDNDGTLVNGPVWTSGKIDGALHFDGINDSIDVGDPPDGSLDFGTADFTLSVWFNTSTPPGFFLCKRAKGYYAGYDFYIQQEGKIFARIADGSSVPDARTTESFDNGFWHHAAAVYDRDGVIRIYVDGQSKATSGDIGGIGSVNNSEPFTIGDRNDPGYHSYFEGYLDDVRIYDKALSGEEIEQLFQDGL